MRNWSNLTGDALTTCIQGCGTKPPTPPSFVLTQNPQIKMVYEVALKGYNDCISACATKANTPSNTPVTPSITVGEGDIRTSRPAPTDKPTQTLVEKEDSTGMSTGAIVGIVLGIAVVGTAIVLAVKYANKP